MFPAEKSAMSSAVLLLSSVISAIHHLPRSLTTPLGYVRSPYVDRYGHQHACRIYPSLHADSGSSACGVTPQDASCAAYHTRTPERAPDRGGSEACHGCTSPAALDTPCRTESDTPQYVQGSQRYGGESIASTKIGPECIGVRLSSPAFSLPTPASNALASCKSAVSNPSVNQP